MDSELPPGELLRRSMRHWVTGVAIVTSRFGEQSHGMTVNSFVSISLDPPRITVTMNNDTRTFSLVEQSGIFAVTILSREQQALAERFAGRLEDVGDRMAGLEVFTLATGAPLIHGGMAYIDCQVVHQYPLPRSTLFVGEVIAALPQSEALEPLLYYNRLFTHLG